MGGFNHNYSVVIKDFTNAAGGDFSPGKTLLFVDNPTHLVWTVYSNDVSEAFFSLSQNDPKAKAFANAGNRLTFNNRLHMMVYRDGRRVWGGWVGEIDETAEDLIVYGYSYESGYYDMLTNFTRKYTGQTVAFIVGHIMDAAIATPNGRVTWITKGIIENPWTDDSQTVGLSLPLYKVPYKRYLVIFKELTAYAISDTQNKVLFEVDPTQATPTFNFWRDRDAVVTSNKFSYPYGKIRSYRRIRRPVNRRSKILAVGSSPTDVTLNIEKINAAVEAEMGHSEEPIYLSFVKDETELNRVVSSRLQRAARVDHDLFVSFHRNSLTPYRALNSDYRVGDDIKILIDQGLGLVDETYVIAGQQVIYYRNMENVRLLLTDRL